MKSFNSLPFKISTNELGYKTLSLTKLTNLMKINNEKMGEFSDYRLQESKILRSS